MPKNHVLRQFRLFAPESGKLIMVDGDGAINDVLTVAATLARIEGESFAVYHVVEAGGRVDSMLLTEIASDTPADVLAAVAERWHLNYSETRQSPPAAPKCAKCDNAPCAGGRFYCLPCFNELRAAAGLSPAVRH
jgi:hypothetical protein